MLQHLKEDGYKYILEILVITLGILGAFALNNWNENRKDRVLEQELLAQLLIELREDVARFKIWSEDHKQVSRHTRQVLYALKNDLPMTDTLLEDFKKITSPFGFVYSQTTYENLSTVGFHTIQDRELRSNVQRLYNSSLSQFDEIMKILNDEFLLTINVQQQEHLIIGEWEIHRGNNVPRDYEALKDNFVFQNTFADAASQHAIVSITLNQLVDEMEEIIKQIEEALS